MTLTDRFERIWHRWVLCPLGKHTHKFGAFDRRGYRGACIWCGKAMPR